MNNEIWFELAKAALSAARAGAEVFASKTRSIEEKLAEKPRVAGEDIRGRLKELAENE